MSDPQQSEWARRLEVSAGQAPASAELRLQQAIERLIAASPDEVLEAAKQSPEEFAKLLSSGSLSQALLRQFIESKRLQDAAELVRILAGCNHRWETELLIRLARGLLKDGILDQAKSVLDLALGGSPPAISVLKGLYEYSIKANRPEEAETYLRRLASADSTYANMVFVYRERQKLSIPPGRTVKVALLSSYVLDWITPYLDDECRKAKLSLEVFHAPFNQYTQEILNPGSELYRFQPDVIVLALALEDIVPQIELNPKEQDLADAQAEILSRVTGFTRELENRTGAIVVIHELALSQCGGYGILDTKVAQGLLPWVAGLNVALLSELKSHDRAYLLPMEMVVGWIGKERSFSPKLSYMASMRLAEPALPVLAKTYMRYIKPLKGLTKKCVVLDLDGTLWGGVVGEVGAEGIALGPSAPGIEYLDFQRALLNLLRRGVLLAICSKNNPEDALPVVRAHPHMVLREEHFAAMRINWKNKADNIREIAQELNIGLDSLVFFDDNPNERELVKQLVPEVLTVELPRDPALYRRTLEELTDFELLALTKEDEMRVAQYRANSQRQAAKSTAASLDVYLASLEIRALIRRAPRDVLTRLVQLFNKTNQFNLTTKRYQTEDVEKLMSSSAVILYDLHVKDRFGDHGLVGTAVVRKEARAWRIDSLLMSCRVMGLGIETAFLARVCADASTERVARLIGEYVPTKKNIPVKDFYAQHGFKLVKEEEGRQEWELDLAQTSVQGPGWVCITTDEEI